MEKKTQKDFLALVRLGLGHSTSFTLDEVNLAAVKELAEKQGLSAIVLDGLNEVRSKNQRSTTVGKVKEEIRCDSLQEKILLAQWIGEVSQLYEQRYEQYLQTIAEMAAFYNRHGFKMMVLKGYACSLDWPKPNHRPCGDIDIWLFGKQKEADEVLAKEKGVEIDRSHHHHTVFTWNDFMVENHYDFIDVHHRKTGPKLETIYKELGQDDSHSIELYGEKVFLPSHNLHALFLLYHTMLHFTSTEMNIRQIMDWGLFVKKHRSKIDWKWLNDKIEEFYLRKFYNIINAICVEDLGFDAAFCHGVEFNPVLKDRVMNDTLSPEFTGDEPKSLLRRFFFRYRRWKSHEWKHKICFEESMWSIFLSAVWSHILKPKSI